MQLLRRGGSVLRASLAEVLPRRDTADAHLPPPPEVRGVVRSAGTALAAAALLLAFTAGAQGAVYGPSAEGGGALAWVFAGFVGAAVIAVFLVVLYLIRPPVPRQPDTPPPGSARDRT
jgi:hypothetical protein